MILLSVVVATYNRLPELQTMLDSLLDQVHGKPVEVLIADDRLTDNTWEWLQARFAGVQHVHLFRAEKNCGPGPARNLCLAAASGRYFTPIDSDFIVMDGAIDTILRAINEHSTYRLLLFPSLQYPGMRRLGSIDGSREIDYEYLLAGDVGEMVAVANMDTLRDQGLMYPMFRAGGESLLWAEILTKGPARFLDSPVVMYRTDVAQRICTLEYQMKHPADLAAISDAMVTLLAHSTSSALTVVRTRKCLASGAYHLLAGNMRTGRQRLISAASAGCLSAIVALVASFAGKDIFRMLFRVYRTRIEKAYL